MSIREFFNAILFTKSQNRDKIYISTYTDYTESKMPDTKKTVGLYTLGCKVNQYESEAIAERLSFMGFEIISPTRECDAYIINTCTVTAESDRKARQFIRRAIAKNPFAYIIVTGCLAQSGADALAKIEGIDAIVGNSQKLLTADILLGLTEVGKKNTSAEIYVSNIDEAPFEEMSISHFDRTRAYVKIEDGCENRCTYCIIPASRGRVRSKRPSDVISEVSALTRGGCKEVVLTGIETASYGKDMQCASLSSLLCEVDRIEGIGRVRLGSLDPSLITRKFLDEISSISSLAPHFHLSLQSGSSRILALMKRKYNREQAMRAIRLLRERIPNVQLTTDVIVGFPDETEADFNETYEFVREARFLNVHIFPYSKRSGTPAAVMTGQVPDEIKKERLHRLEVLCGNIRRELLELEVEKDQDTTVLFETFKDGYAYGHTPSFIEVAVKSPSPLHAEVHRVTLTDTDGRLCFGKIKNL